MNYAHMISRKNTVKISFSNIVCMACRPRASAGTSRGHAGVRWRNGTWACRSAAIRLGGSLSWATDHRNSSVAPRPPRAPVTHPYDSATFARYRRVRVPLGAILGRLLRRGMRPRSGRLSRIGDSAPERDAIKGGRVVHGGCPRPHPSLCRHGARARCRPAQPQPSCLSSRTSCASWRSSASSCRSDHAGGRRRRRWAMAARMAFTCSHGTYCLHCRPPSRQRRYQ